MNGRGRLLATITVGALSGVEALLATIGAEMEVSN